nr:unnamed protein product [Spirometra erinaceieuropaei]
MHPKKCNSRLFFTVCLSLLLLQLPPLQCRFVTTDIISKRKLLTRPTKTPRASRQGTRARNIHLTSNINAAERVSEGQKITLTCSDISTDRENNGGVDGGALRILRKRSASSGGGSDGFEDMASVVSVDLVAPELRDITCTFEVSRLDDEAVFICGDAETLGFTMHMPTTATLTLRVQLHQAALRAPVIAEYKLNVLYPPTVEIISLPPEPKEAQSVTLSCLAHGGNPPEDMRFSWRYAKTLDLGAYPPSPSGNVDSVFAKTLVGALNASQMAALFSTMKREPGQLHRHLMLDSVDVDNMGWYGCEVNNAGGTAQTLHLLLLDFAPRIRAETKFIQHAEIGMPAELLLVVDTRPSRADVTWFWIEEGSSLANKARHKILAQRDAGDAYDSGVSRLPRSPAAAAGNTSPLKVVSTSTAPWLGRVRKSSLTVAPDRLKVSLSFREVIHSDFGIYMCQLNHKAGSREFYFELKPQSAARGIKPESVKISSDGRIARLEFEPPNSQFYSRIVLRICLAVKQLPALPGSAGTLRPLTGPAFLRPVDQLADQPRRLQAGVDATGAASQENDAAQSRVAGEGECTDYQVTFAELGYLQVEIERPISEYTFQFLVYMDSELKQVTRPVRWTREPKPVHAGPHKFFIQLIIGVLTTLIAVCLLVLMVYYICSLMKRRGHKKMTVDLTNGVHPNLRPYQILEPSKPIVTLGTGQGSIGAGSGSLQPLYPRQSIGSSCPSAKGVFAAQNLSLTTSPTLLDNGHFQLRSSSSVGSQMSTLTQRLISEVYMAAAKAASRAVTESIASGSIDGVDIQDRHRHHNHHDDGGSTFRRSSHYAESGSITGGSLSGIEGMTGYQANQMTGTLRSTSVNETASQRSNASRFRKSPATSAISPSSEQVFQFGQRRASVTSNGHQNWSPLPMFTPNATRRLNEAASALAAAATAAVLEATQASPLPLNSAVPAQPQIGRFGSTSMTTHATSSEDGESTNSSTFFPRKRGPYDNQSGGHFGRKRVLQNSRRTSVSRGGDGLLPMLTVPVQFIQTSAAAETGSGDGHQVDNYLRSPTEAGCTNGASDSTTESPYTPAIPLTVGPWAQKFQTINADEASHKSSPYSDLASDVTLSTFTNQTSMAPPLPQQEPKCLQAPPTRLPLSPSQQADKTLDVDTLRSSGNAVIIPTPATADV